MKINPVIEEVRKIRTRISEKYGHDSKKVIDFYRRKQKKHASRFWKGKTANTK